MVDKTYTKKDIIAMLFTDQVIEDLIEYRRNGKNKVLNEFCDQRGNCKDCFQGLGLSCDAIVIIDKILDRLIENEFKFKLTKFEYDLLKFEYESLMCMPLRSKHNDDIIFNESLLLMSFKNNGFFIDVPEYILIKKVLDNYEVI